MDYNNSYLLHQKPQQWKYSAPILYFSECSLMIQHLFSKQKGWKYGKTNSASSAEMLQMDQKLKISHYCLKSKSGKFLTSIPLPQFLNSLFNCYFKFYRLRIKNWNAFEFLCGQDMWWGQVSWLRKRSSLLPRLHNAHCGRVGIVNI